MKIEFTQLQMCSKSSAVKNQRQPELVLCTVCPVAGTLLCELWADNVFAVFSVSARMYTEATACTMFSSMTCHQQYLQMT